MNQHKKTKTKQLFQEKENNDIFDQSKKSTKEHHTITFTRNRNEYIVTEIRLDKIPTKLNILKN